MRRAELISCCKCGTIWYANWSRPFNEDFDVHNGSIPLNAPHQPTSAVLLSSSAVSFVQIGGDAHSISEWRTARRRNGDGASEQEVADSDYGPSGRNPGDRLIREFSGGDEEGEPFSPPSESSRTSGQSEQAQESEKGATADVDEYDESDEDIVPTVDSNGVGKRGSPTTGKRSPSSSLVQQRRLGSGRSPVGAPARQAEGQQNIELERERLRFQKERMQQLALMSMVEVESQIVRSSSSLHAPAVDTVAVASPTMTGANSPILEKEAPGPRRVVQSEAESRAGANVDLMNRSSAAGRVAAPGAVGSASSSLSERARQDHRLRKLYAQLKFSRGRKKLRTVRRTDGDKTLALVESEPEDGSVRRRAASSSGLSVSSIIEDRAQPDVGADVGLSVEKSRHVEGGGASSVDERASSLGNSRRRRSPPLGGLPAGRHQHDPSAVSPASVTTENSTKVDAEEVLGQLLQRVVIASRSTKKSSSPSREIDEDDDEDFHPSHKATAVGENHSPAEQEENQSAAVHGQHLHPRSTEAEFPRRRPLRQRSRSTGHEEIDALLQLNRRSRSLAPPGQGRRSKSSQTRSSNAPRHSDFEDHSIGEDEPSVPQPWAESLLEQYVHPSSISRENRKSKRPWREPRPSWYSFLQIQEQATMLTQEDKKAQGRTRTRRITVGKRSVSVSPDAEINTGAQDEEDNDSAEDLTHDPEDKIKIQRRQEPTGDHSAPSRRAGESGSASKSGSRSADLPDGGDIEKEAADQAEDSSRAVRVDDTRDHGSTRHGVVRKELDHDRGAVSRRGEQEHDPHEDSHPGDPSHHDTEDHSEKNGGDDDERNRSGPTIADLDAPPIGELPYEENQNRTSGRPNDREREDRRTTERNNTIDSSEDSGRTTGSMFHDIVSVFRGTIWVLKEVIMNIISSLHRGRMRFFTIYPPERISIIILKNCPRVEPCASCTRYSMNHDDSPYLYLSLTTRRQGVESTGVGINDDSLRPIPGSLVWLQDKKGQLLRSVSGKSRKGRPCDVHTSECPHAEFCSFANMDSLTGNCEVCPRGGLADCEIYQNEIGGAAVSECRDRCTPHPKPSGSTLGGPGFSAQPKEVASRSAKEEAVPIPKSLMNQTQNPLDPEGDDK